MTFNKAFRRSLLFYLGIQLITGCSTKEPLPSGSPAEPPKIESKDSIEETVEVALKKLQPHLSFLENEGREQTISQYRKNYRDFMARNPEQSHSEKRQALMELVEESILSLSAPDTKDKNCIIQRDFLSADLIPAVNEIEILYKRQLKKAAISELDIKTLKDRLSLLDRLNVKISKLCRPYRDTLQLLNSEARLDAGYILNGGAAPGRATPDDDAEVDELLNDGKKSGDK